MIRTFSALPRCVMAMLIAGIPLAGQEPVVYHVSFANRAHHEATITATFSNLPAKPLTLRMSRSSPGRYSLHEFARHVHNLSAVNGRGKALPVYRSDPHSWTIGGHDGMVQIAYTLFGDQADGTSTGIDETHAHLNMPATFIWAEGLDAHPVRVTFVLPERDWQIVTQLPPTRWSDTFTAPNLQYFMDSPTEIGPVVIREWTANDARGATIRLAMHHNGSDKETDAFAAMIKAIVTEETAIWGELPAFDYGTYTFIADYLPHVFNDGMEHRNSTILTRSSSLKMDLLPITFSLAHEFMHAWNVERIRPRSLEPFNFSAMNMSAELWFAEGFSTYYQYLVLKRTGIIHLDRFAGNLSRALNSVLNSPAREYDGPAEMSRRAPLVDRAKFGGASNLHNTFLSYYTYGAIIGLALDLLLRQNFEDLSLDTYMQAVWEAHGRNESPYTNMNLQAILARVTGDDFFAARFFEDYIYSGDLPDLPNLLSQAGLLVRQADPGKAWIGANGWRSTDEGLVLDGAATKGSPLYLAGLDRGATLLTLAGEPTGTTGELAALLASRKPGERVEITFRNRSGEQSAQIQLAQDPRLEVVPYEHGGMQLSEEILKFRGNWLSSKASSGRYGLERHCPQCRRSYPFANEYCHFDGTALALVLPENR